MDCSQNDAHLFGVRREGGGVAIAAGMYILGLGRFEIDEIAKQSTKSKIN